MDTSNHAMNEIGRCSQGNPEVKNNGLYKQQAVLNGVFGVEEDTWTTEDNVSRKARRTNVFASHLTDSPERFVLRKLDVNMEIKLRQSPSMSATSPKRLSLNLTASLDNISKSHENTGTIDLLMPYPPSENHEPWIEIQKPEEDMVPEKCTINEERTTQPKYTEVVCDAVNRERSPRVKRKATAKECAPKTAVPAVSIVKNANPLKSILKNREEARSVLSTSDQGRDEMEIEKTEVASQQTKVLKRTTRNKRKTYLEPSSSLQPTVVSKKHVLRNKTKTNSEPHSSPQPTMVRSKRANRKPKASPSEPGTTSNKFNTLEATAPEKIRMTRSRKGPSNSALPASQESENIALDELAHTRQETVGPKKRVNRRLKTNSDATDPPKPDDGSSNNVSEATSPAKIRTTRSRKGNSKDKAVFPTNQGSRTVSKRVTKRAKTNLDAPDLEFDVGSSAQSTVVSKRAKKQPKTNSAAASNPPEPESSNAPEVTTSRRTRMTRSRKEDSKDEVAPLTNQESKSETSDNHDAKKVLRKKPQPASTLVPERVTRSRRAAVS